MRKRIVVLIVLAMVLSSCAAFQEYWGAQPYYPHLEAGIRMTEWQMDLQDRYLRAKEEATEEELVFLEEEVAPNIDKAKYKLSLYNEAVLADERPIYKEHEIRAVLLEAEIELRELESLIELRELEVTDADQH